MIRWECKARALPCRIDPVTRTFEGGQQSGISPLSSSLALFSLCWPKRRSSVTSWQRSSSKPMRSCHMHDLQTRSQHVLSERSLDLAVPHQLFDDDEDLSRQRTRFRSRKWLALKAVWHIRRAGRRATDSPSNASLRSISLSPRLSVSSSLCHPLPPISSSPSLPSPIRTSLLTMSSSDHDMDLDDETRYVAS